MIELGIDITTQHSKSTDGFRDIEFDLVVTVCDGAAANCPVWLGQHVGQIVNLPFPDPAAATGGEKEQLEVFRQVRDDLRQRILTHLKQVEHNTKSEQALDLQLAHLHQGERHAARNI
jgi:arsenate reductase